MKSAPLSHAYLIFFSKICFIWPMRRVYIHWGSTTKPFNRRTIWSFSEYYFDCGLHTSRGAYFSVMNVNGLPYHLASLFEEPSGYIDIDRAFSMRDLFDLFRCRCDSGLYGHVVVGSISNFLKPFISASNSGALSQCILLCFPIHSCRSRSRSRVYWLRLSLFSAAGPPLHTVVARYWEWSNNVCLRNFLLAVFPS